MYCPHCAAEVVEGVRFCRSCGADLAAQVGAVPVAGGPSPVPGGPPAPLDANRDGPPWEHRQGPIDFGALIETITAVLFRPTQTFTTMRRHGGIESPLLFALVPGVVALVINAAIQSAFGPQLRSVLESMRDQVPPGLTALMESASAGPMAQAVGVVVGVMMMIVMLFLGAGVLHVCLLMTGGATQPYETTFRAYCYSRGAFVMLEIIPGCGMLLSLFWGLAVTVIGLARAHDTDTWRSAVAVSIPGVACCGIGLAGFGLFATFLGGGH